MYTDCTGKTQAGLKWLKHVHEEACKVDPGKYQRIPEGKLLHDKLRLKYDIQGVVRGFFFNITPSMASRLPIPGGYANAGWLLTVLSEPGADNRCAIMTKFEGNRSKSWSSRSKLLFSFITFYSSVWSVRLGEPSVSGNPC